MITVVNANALHIPLADGCVQTVVTSPPYYSLRDYNVPGQIGLEPTPEEYVANMVTVFREVWRVLRDDGCVFLNLGDSYFTQPAGNKTPSGFQQKSKAGQSGALAQFNPNRVSAQRVKPCDTSGKEPASYPDRDCFCESLCDVCARAYQIGKSHNGFQRAPKPEPSLSETIPEHKVSPHDHLPTLDLVLPEVHNERAIPGSKNLQDREGGQPLSSQASMPDLSSPQPPASFHRSDTLSVCPLCSRSFSRSSRVSVDKSLCPCGQYSTSVSNQRLDLRRRDKVLIDGASDYHNEDRAYDFAYPDFTTTSHLKQKDLCGIPWRTAFALQADGWYLRSDIIWSKPNPMPESVTDRPTKAHEYVFLLSKQARYYWDADAVREKDCGHNGKRPYYPETEGVILGRDTDPHGGLTKEWESGNGRNLRTVWTIATQPYSGSHFATFPERLVEPCVKAGTSERGCCPKCGKGWVRMVEKDSGYGDDTEEYSGKQIEMDPQHSGRRMLLNMKRMREQGRDHDNPFPTKTTTGWQPGCTCDAGDPIPCVVLDPFAGTATVGKVCARLGRSFIGTELKLDYISLAQERTSEVQVEMQL